MIFRSKVLPELRRLHPERDAQRMMLLTCRCDFPFDTTRALEFALFRTFCVPSVGALLDRTQEFGKRTQRRYDDTDLIMSEIVEHGYESERGQRAIARMNAIHGRFAISNADFLYVLSTFVFEPIRWIERFGWRSLEETEKEAMFFFWRAVGERMHIAEIPTSAAALEEYNRAYEREHFRGNAASSRVAEATMRMFAGWAPFPLRRVVPVVMAALMDEPLRRALNLQAPPAWVERGVASALRGRGLLAEGFWPRKIPSLRTNMRHRTYPDGYRIETLGPPGEKQPTG